jgi:hypothetical protein
MLTVCEFRPYADLSKSKTAANQQTSDKTGGTRAMLAGGRAAVRMQMPGIEDVSEHKTTHRIPQGVKENRTNARLAALSQYNAASQNASQEWLMQQGVGMAGNALA